MGSGLLDLGLLGSGLLGSAHPSPGAFALKGCLYGLLFGAAAAFGRTLGYTEEACIYALLLCNILARPIDMGVNSVR